MIGRLFRAHGEFCASHPWEVIVALLTITACMLTVDKNNTLDASSNGLGTASAAAAAGAATAAGASGASIPPPVVGGGSATSSRHRPCHGWSQSCDGLEAEYNAADVILMTIVRCTAVLYCYYQFCSLHRMGSKYVLGECSSSSSSDKITSLRQIQCGARVLTQVVRMLGWHCLSPPRTIFGGQKKKVHTQNPHKTGMFGQVFRGGAAGSPPSSLAFLTCALNDSTSAGRRVSSSSSSHGWFPSPFQA